MDDSTACQNESLLFGNYDKSPVYEAPHLWHPIFLDDKIESMKDKHTFGYERERITKDGARVSVLEPNISVLKNCMIPILIGEEAYRHHPDPQLKHIYLCNTYDKRMKMLSLITLAIQVL